ncbi:hypothetical protein [Mucilaginibacter lacusdianchii]|uniref:hypothetical protein n=1 Tax=Mucilaginibacter lacusdianchii TaxID=2684211 RepID=UPI00131C5FE1|nr:hypothetical protein [Mucilaginibacter sp. JXJ CY 39]
MNIQYNRQVLYRIRIYIWIIIIGLALSGITAFPIETELSYWLPHLSNSKGFLTEWVNRVYVAVHRTNLQYPFLSYGTDWLAFAHLMLAILFVGPLRDPVKNIWVIQFGMIASVLIIPLAFIAGPIRHIPFFWQLIDCSFGVICMIPLYLSYKDIKILTKNLQRTNI